MTALSPINLKSSPWTYSASDTGLIVPGPFVHEPRDLAAARGTPGPRGKRPTPVTPYASILEEDPELGKGLSETERRAAENLLRAPVMTVRGARWDPPDFNSSRGLGLLVLDGLIGRRLHIGPAVAIELLTCGDILRPWEPPPEDALVPMEDEWRVFRRARLAVLDQRITALIGHWPEVTVAFSRRLLRRANVTAALMAISHLRRVEDKLLGTFWLLAGSCGRVIPHGVRIPFRLTHEVIGEIIGAQRPSVTLAVKHLREHGQIRCDSDGAYVLTGDPLEWAGDWHPAL